MSTWTSGHRVLSHAARRARLSNAPSRWVKQRRLVGLALSAPMAVIVLVFFAVPVALMIWMSFNAWPLLGSSAPNGVANYSALADPLLGRAMLFTVKYTVVATVMLAAVSLGLALLFQTDRPGARIFRAAFFLPASVGLASASLLFYGLFSSEASPLNALVRWIGLGEAGVDWLGDGDNALLSVVGMMTWRFAGFYMIIIMTGLQSINPLLYEVARTDGAGRWQTLRDVTFPLLRPTFALVLVLLVTSSLLAFDQFFILTGGRHDTATVVITVYREAFTAQDLGRAAAISVTILAALVMINGMQLRILRRGDSR